MGAPPAPALPGRRWAAASGRLPKRRAGCPGGNLPATPHGSPALPALCAAHSRTAPAHPHAAPCAPTPACPPAAQWWRWPVASAVFRLNGTNTDHVEATVKVGGRRDGLGVRGAHGSVAWAAASLAPSSTTGWRLLPVWVAAPGLACAGRLPARAPRSPRAPQASRPAQPWPERHASRVPPCSRRPQEWRASPEGHQPMIESRAVTQEGWGEGGALAAKLFR